MTHEDKTYKIKQEELKPETPKRRGKQENITFCLYTRWLETVLTPRHIYLVIFATNTVEICPDIWLKIHWCRV